MARDSYDDLEAVILPAEINRNTSPISAERYGPTTLVMVFPPGELAELRQILRGR